MLPAPSSGRCRVAERSGSVWTLVGGVVFSSFAFLACSGDESQRPAGAPADAVSLPGETFVEEDPNAPGVRELAPGRYEAVLRAFHSGFAPAEVRVPAGSEVTFRLISLDDPHGFHVEGTDIRIDLLPGMEREVTHTFEEAGEYSFMCDVYCGGGHDFMRGRVIVE